MTNRNREYIDFLKQRFDETKFIDFISDLLNLSSDDINSSKNEIIPEQKQFRDTIEYYKFVANYTSNSDRIGTFIVKLTAEGSQNARTAQRTFISTLLNKYDLDASLVAFYQENEPSWRLSFVKKELNFTEKGIKVDLTPAKRFSYLVGEHESVHTAQEYLFSLLNIDSHKITLSEIEKVFDVEKVTQRFFEEYKEKYLVLKEYLDKNQDFITESENLDFTSEEFAKKLMGQIVFLYFLQKKGWLGVQLVPEKLSNDEYYEISSRIDSICNNLLEKYYVKETDGYTIDINKIKNETIKDNINTFISIFKGTKYDKPWGTGDKKFVRNMFRKSRLDHSKDNFFDEYLEPFFYTGLNEKREYQYFVLFNCKIPFLNGGLFEPLNGYRWASAQFNIPDEMFSNDNNDGILDIFDLYNFTIDEEEPLEKDIAVDPEMMGKIFEELLDVKDRKNTGSFYTPRDIVHYMCQETLANYLTSKVNIDYSDIIQFIKYGDEISQYDWGISIDGNYDFKVGKTIYNNLIEIDDALYNVKIADPAVGSGAFPLGMLNEIIKLRSNLQTYILIKNDMGKLDLTNLYNTYHLETNIYNMKLQVIENSIYAVDLEPSAIEIAKLRLWLSLIVDYPSELEPKPLPNLDCKIMQGNSLVDKFEGIKLFSEKVIKNSMRKNASKTEVQQNIFGDLSDIIIQQTLDFDDEESNYNTYIDNMINLQKQYFNAFDSNQKKELKKKIDNIQFGMIQNSLKNDLSKFKKFNKVINKKKKPWFIWQLEFYDVFRDKGGFDIVIGNPPYVSTKGSEDDDKNNLIDIYGFYDDLYNHFIFKSIDLLKDNGILSMITSNTYFTTYTKKGLRNKILENQLIKIVDLGYNVFKSAMVSTAIIEIKKNENNKIFKSYIVDAKESSNIDSAVEYEIYQNIYNNSINNSFFIPNESNLKINKILGAIHNDLLNTYWKYISTSKNISKYSGILSEYRNNLKAGDWTLVGLVCDGGQGLATGNNGKYLGIIEGTSEAYRMLNAREKKLFDFNKEYKTNYEMPQDEMSVWNLFDSLKEKYGRDIFGQGFVYKIVNKELLADLSSLSEEEKENGISDKKCFVPYDKGDKEGNRWYFDNPFVINWSKKSVTELKENAGKKGPGGSRYQNSQFYFREGFCYMDVHTKYLKARKKGISVHDVMGMSFFPLTNKIPYYYLICLINSEYIANFVFNFLNNTSHFQINDCRMLPVPVPTEEQLLEFRSIYESAEKVQLEYFSGRIMKPERDNQLNFIQKKLDSLVDKLYLLN